MENLWLWGQHEPATPWIRESEWLRISRVTDQAELDYWGWLEP